jgi:hypothetical protein
MRKGRIRIREAQKHADPVDPVPVLVWIMDTLIVAKIVGETNIRRDPDPHWEYGSGPRRAKNDPQM